ncbi:FkbM family methyltransferase [Asanoa ferruginea]|nr:FkbM family methyltransferase [Asanoa ferruginea]
MHHPITSIARTRYGARIPVTTSDLIQRYLYMFGTWEPNLTAWICGQLRPGDDFIDVGANVGHFSLLAASLIGPSGRVVAIEASPRLAATLVQTATANGYKNVRVVSSAVSAAAGELTFYIKDRNNLGGTTSIRPRKQPPAAFSAPTASLPDLLSATELENARIIKIDVEGSEADVMDGLSPHLHRLRPDAELAIEISPKRLARQGRTPRDVTAPMHAAGFRRYRIDNSYAPRSYAERQVTPPHPWPHPITEMSDLIFSRSHHSASPSGPHATR